LYFGIRNSFLKTKVDPDFSTLGVISRPVVEVFLRMSDRDRWLGFRPAVRRLSFSEGYEGTRSYTLSKLTRGGRPMVDEDDFYVVPARDDPVAPAETPDPRRVHFGDCLGSSRISAAASPSLWLISLAKSSFSRPKNFDSLVTRPKCGVARQQLLHAAR
jgi:hypothetical protein